MKSWFKGFPQSPSEYLGFPEPLLGPISWRLPILASGEGWKVIFKPPGCLAGPDSRWLGTPSLTAAWEEQFRAGKPELLKTELPVVKPVYSLDEDVHGPVLLAQPGGVLEGLRNELGSDQFRFRFEFLATDGGSVEEEFEVDLPIKIQEDQEKGDVDVHVTHRYGKKSLTRFRRLKRWGNMGLWEAYTSYPRLFQIRIHAWESRLRMVGEKRFGRVNELYLSTLKPGYTTSDEEERPIWPGLALRLADVSWSGQQVVVPPVGPWAATLKQLDRYGYRKRR